MKRELCAGALLLLLMLGAALNIRHIDALTGAVSGCLERAEAEAGLGDYEAALGALDRGLAIWDGAHGYTNVFIRHPELDDIYDCFYELRETLLQRDAAALPAAFQKVQYHLDCIAFMEHISAGSVF